MRTTNTPSQIAGRYEIAGRIGSGGMGDVLRAHDKVLGRTVALKILPFDLAIQPGFVDRFRAEAQAVAQIQDANVVQVHDWGQEDETYFMVMEYVRGKNLRQILAATPDGYLHAKQAAQITGQVLGALGAAHDKGVVHRDVKPENVMVATDGRVKVADFGIARVLKRAVVTGGMMGTVAYVSPEQARGEAVDARADVYSTGCMLFELLTGSLPFEGDSAKVLKDHLHNRVPAPSDLMPSVPDNIDRIVLKATSPLREDRYQSAAEMRKVLSAAITSLPEAPPLSDLTGEFTSEDAVDSFSTVVHRTPKKKKRGWLKFLVTLLLVSGLGAGVYFVGPTQVPEIDGVEKVVAQGQIERAGLKGTFREAFSDRTPGTVIASKPSPGAWTRQGEAVVVSISAGPKLSDVPSVIGMQFESASQAIVDADLQVVVTRRNDREPLNKVVDQNPKPSTIRSGELVTLVVSDGPAILDIPALSNKPVAEAEKILTDLGFVVAREPVFNAAASGTVLSHKPAAGEKHPQGTTVKLQVSKGLAPFPMPDVKGKVCSEAKGLLEGLGMKVVTQSSGGGAATCGGNKVLEQDPLPGGNHKAGQEATLYVS